jgi:hypothetical protein
VAYDPKEIYKKLALLLGGTKGKAEESRGEYMDVPGVGAVRIGGYERSIPKSAGGWAPEWDARELWETGSATEGYKPRYGQGEIAPWVKQAGDLFSASAKAGASQEDLAGLADHWINGTGVNPFYAQAHANMPSWMKEYLKGIMGGYATASGQTPAQ